MYTFCPTCHSIFRLTTRHLATAGGYTRCGECHMVYNAIECIYEELDEARAALNRSRQPVAAPTEAEQPEQQAGTRAVHADTGRIQQQVPVHAGRWQQRTFTMRDVFSGMAIVFLLVLLATQWVFFNRAELAGKEDWRPGLEQFCRFLGCSLPMRVDLSQIRLLDRDVRQHPRVDDALLVNLTLSNQAAFIQPYPVLEVRFSGLDGKPVALRRFRPQEYVHDIQSITYGMPTGKPVQVVLEIVDPGESAVSYQFGFL
jgi:predicted Zn finger-like uncharacterized protein